jgi:hypothetical protein
MSVVKIDNKSLKTINFIDEKIHFKGVSTLENMIIKYNNSFDGERDEKKQHIK